jgi:hypothetical protein
MKGTILQPTYLPWLGYFEMIDASEIYVVFDHVQFVKKSWQQRNRIKTANGVVILTIPIHREQRSDKISEIKISYDRENPLEKHWKTINLAYGKAKYFGKYKSVFQDIYSKKYTYLKDLNVEIIRNICQILNINTKIILSSELDLNVEILGKTEEIISLCKSVGITHLYDAKGAESFIDASLFKKEDIILEFQEFEHPKYNQLWGDFVPYLSIIDLLFNEGEKSMDIIRSGKR